MDMYLQILVLGSLLAFVNSGVVPNYSQVPSWLRLRRSALSAHRPHRLLDNNEHYKRHYYKKLEDDSEESGESGNDLDEVKIFPSNRRVTVYDEPGHKSPDSSFSQSQFSSDNISPSAGPIISTLSPISKGHSEIKNDAKRRIFIQPHSSGDSNYVEKQDRETYSSPINVGKVHSYISAPQRSPVEHEEEHHGPAKYEFKYSVHDLDHFDVKSHQEARDGEHTVGEYSVLQPDGTILTVKYTVHGDEGFNAIVSKSELPNDELRGHHKA